MTRHSLLEDIKRCNKCDQYSTYREAICQDSAGQFYITPSSVSCTRPQRWGFSSRNATRKQYPALPDIKARLSPPTFSFWHLRKPKALSQAIAVFTQKREMDSHASTQMTKTDMVFWATFRYQKSFCFTPPGHPPGTVRLCFISPGRPWYTKALLKATSSLAPLPSADPSENIPTTPCPS